MGYPLALCVLLGLQGGILLLFAAFCAFRGVSFTTSSLRPWGGSRKLPKTVGCPKVPYKEFISAVAESIFQFLGLWALIFFILALYAFISFHFGLLGLHFSFSASILAFGASILPLRALRGGILWLFVSFWAFRGASFCSLRLFEPSGGYPSQLLMVSCWGSSPQVAKNSPFAQRPYNGFISAVTGSILQFLAFWAFISLHFGLVGLHFLAFWPCGPSFPCILAFWAFISLHFVHFLAF